MGLVYMKNTNFFIPKKIIGAVHFMPSPGFEGHQSFEDDLEKAKKDTEAFVNGGVSALIFENNYDYPHSVIVSKTTKNTMIRLIQEIAPSIPFGVSVLWNDYRSALDIAKETGGKFIRIPVFVDRVKTQYGVIEPSSEDVIAYRRQIEAEDVLLFTDIHVKHAEILSDMSIIESAKKAIEQGSDVLVITGAWTGQAPVVNDLKEVREVVEKFPILVGSGANSRNIQELLSLCDGAIVSTSLKEGQADAENINIKSYNQRIDIEKVKNFMSKVNI